MAAGEVPATSQRINSPGGKFSMQHAFLYSVTCQLESASPIIYNIHMSMIVVCVGWGYAAPDHAMALAVGR